jgi:hypothetical protein
VVRVELEGLAAIAGAVEGSVDRRERVIGAAVEVDRAMDLFAPAIVEDAIDLVEILVTCGEQD